MPSNPFGYGELRVFTPHRRPIGCIYPVKGINTAWPGDATFTVPQKGLRWTTLYLQHLNLIEYHDSRTSRVWLGVIIDHAPNGQEVTVTCKSAEWFYSNRFTDWVWDAYVGRAGDIVRLFHDSAARWDYMPIVPGDIDYTGPTYEIEYQLKGCKDGLDEIAAASGGVWYVEKKGHDHLTPWQLTFKTQPGRDRTRDILICAEVIDPPDQKFSAIDFKTAAFVLGGGISNEIDDRLKFYITNRPASAVYNTLQAVIDLGTDPVDPTLVQQLGIEKLIQMGIITPSFGLNIDNRRNTWPNLEVYDRVRLMLSKVGYVGYDGQATIKGLQLDIDSGKMGLVLEALV
jgi:hypothetical protein